MNKKQGILIGIALALLFFFVKILNCGTASEKRGILGVLDVY